MISYKLSFLKVYKNCTHKKFFDVSESVNDHLMINVFEPNLFFPSHTHSLLLGLFICMSYISY